jgi:hypothetical protein
MSRCATTAPTPNPLALQIARLFGLLLLAIAALGIAATVFRAQADRLQVRFARALVIMLGLTDESIGLLRRLSADRDSRTTLAVLVEDAGNPLIKMARGLGARVAVCDIDDPPALRTLLTSQARFSVRALYAVSADVSVNLRWAAQFRAIADTTKPSTSDMPPRMIVRIDDPWQAEYWRRTNAYRTGGRGKSASVRWMSDALSVYEVTAALILDRILTGDYDRLVLVGSSPLALAVCAELAQREREGALLNARPKPSFPALVMFGPEAETLRQQHRLRQERFGNSAAWDLITVATLEPTSANLRELLRNDSQPAFDPRRRSGAGNAGPGHVHGGAQPWLDDLRLEHDDPRRRRRAGDGEPLPLRPDHRGGERLAGGQLGAGRSGGTRELPADARAAPRSSRTLAPGLGRRA